MPSVWRTGGVLLGSLFALSIVSYAAHRGFLVPKKTWDFSPSADWPASWSGKLKMNINSLEKPGSMTISRAWAPYLLLAIFLVLSRLDLLPFKSILTNIKFGWSDILGTGISGSTAPFYLPGSILILVAIITVVLHKLSRSGLKAAVGESSRMLIGAGFVLVFTVPMVRIYINSGVNDLGISSMPIAMAEWVAGNVGAIWPLFAPIIGALGAFIAGSNTVSNLMFSLFQFGVAERLNFAPSIIVSLQAVGAAAGNMVAIHNVVAASATVGLLGQEGNTLRKTIIPTVYYVTIIGLLGLLIIKYINVSDPLM